MTRSELLDKAKETVCKDRVTQYGKPEKSFSFIAQLWESYLNEKGADCSLVAEDVANMMILLKVAREAHSPKVDNFIDIAGYAACGNEVMIPDPVHSSSRENIQEYN